MHEISHINKLSNPNRNKAIDVQKPESKPNDFDKVKEFREDRALMSKELGYATKATAMAQVLMGSNLKFTTTPKEYINSLIKQGKIPNKHFYTGESENSEWVTELNSEGEKTKEVRFFKGYEDLPPWVGCVFYNPKTQHEYKSIEFKQDGGVSISHEDPKSGRPIRIEKYRPDGSIERIRNCEKMEDTNISKGGKINKHKIINENGDWIDKFFDDYGNVIYEGKRE